MSKSIQTIGELIHDRTNPRKHNPRNLKVIVDSLQDVGFARSIVIDENNEILAGNGVTEAAAIAGIERVIEVEADGNTIIAVRRRGLTDEQKQRMKYYDNRSGELAEWDTEQLLADIGAGVDFSGMFRQDELDALLEGLTPTPEPVNDDGGQIDKAEELRQKWQVETGQLWALGDNHRLICGDCTDAAVVARVMGGEKAVCMWTDPPYGVSYVGKTKDALKIENDGSEGLLELLSAAFSVADQAALAEGASYYIAAPAGPQFYDFATALIRTGWKWHETLVWVKNSMVLGHSDYHYKHEAVFYGWKGKNRNWYAGRDKVSVFEVDRPSRSEEHPTMKPPELVIAMLENSTGRGDIVYEPFDGSGTTLMACEALGRCCRAIELSPAYVAVALQRWADATGKTPVLVA